MSIFTNHKKSVKNCILPSTQNYQIVSSCLRPDLPYLKVTKLYRLGLWHALCGKPESNWKTSGQSMENHWPAPFVLKETVVSKSCTNIYSTVITVAFLLVIYGSIFDQNQHGTGLVSWRQPSAQPHRHSAVPASYMHVTLCYDVL